MLDSIIDTNWDPPNKLTDEYELIEDKNFVEKTDVNMEDSDSNFKPDSEDKDDEPYCKFEKYNVPEEEHKPEITIGATKKER